MIKELTTMVCDKIDIKIPYMDLISIPEQKETNDVFTSTTITMMPRSMSAMNNRIEMKVNAMDVTLDILKDNPHKLIVEHFDSLNIETKECEIGNLRHTISLLNHKMMNKTRLGKSNTLVINETTYTYNKDVYDELVIEIVFNNYVIDNIIYLINKSSMTDMGIKYLYHMDNNIEYYSIVMLGKNAIDTIQKINLI